MLEENPKCQLNQNYMTCERGSVVTPQQEGNVAVIWESGSILVLEFRTYLHLDNFSTTSDFRQELIIL